MKIEEIYSELCKYANQNVNDDNIWIKDGYCRICSTEFIRTINEMDSGHKNSLKC